MGIIISIILILISFFGSELLLLTCIGRFQFVHVVSPSFTMFLSQIVVREWFNVRNYKLECKRIIMN